MLQYGWEEDSSPLHREGNFGDNTFYEKVALFLKDKPGHRLEKFYDHHNLRYRYVIKTPYYPEHGPMAALEIFWNHENQTNVRIGSNKRVVNVKVIDSLAHQRERGYIATAGQQPVSTMRKI